MTGADIIVAARTVEAGSYVYEYDDATDERTSMPIGMGDDQADEARQILTRRGLRMETDDHGWLVSEVVS